MYPCSPAPPSTPLPQSQPSPGPHKWLLCGTIWAKELNNILDNQALLRCPSQGELLTSSRRTPASHMEPHPLLRDTPSSSGTTPSTQGATTTPACGHRLASARQRLGRRTNHRHYKRVRCYMQLVFSRRFRQRQFQHCRGLYRPSYVLYPKYRCYY